MWKQYRYIPFYTSSKERLTETLQKLLDEKGFPRYPEHTLDYVIAGFKLRSWLNFLENFQKFSDEDFENLTSIVRMDLRAGGDTPSYFFIEGMLREVITNPEGVTEVIENSYMTDAMFTNLSVKGVLAWETL